MKILVVDDSKAIHLLLEEMLENHNITFQHVYNGEEAIQVLSQENFNADLILLDWEMPKVTGIEALPLLKKHRPEIIVMMMTSKNSMKDIAEALEKGATDYVMKPFTKDILIGKVASVLGKDI